MNNTVFLHTPRTGGTSIRKAVMFSDRPDITVSRDIDRGGFFIMPEAHALTANDTLCLSVRNPYTRWVSIFTSRMRGKNPTPELFMEFLKMASKISYIKDNDLYRNCSHWLIETPAQVKFIKFENLVDDTKQILDIDLTEFSHRKKTFYAVNPDLSCYYNKRSLRLLNELADADFNNFGYTKYHTIPELVDACL